MVAARAEVVGLHEFFVGWFTGRLDRCDAIFARLVDALRPDFSMVTPSGQTLDGDAVVASVHAAYHSAAGSFAIEIRDVVARAVTADAVLVTYEEHQFEGDRRLNRRASTAYLVRAPGAPSGVQWQHLHETLRSD